METEDEIEGVGVFRSIQQLALCAISGALTGFFAIGGAFTGAIAGSLAGRASDSGLLRGAALGAIAGAVLSVEMLEASRAYWCLEQTGSRGPSSMVNIANIDYDEIHGVHGIIASRGLSVDSIQKLPHHVVLKEMKSEHCICCSICLQDIEVGEFARSLPRCHHTFHLLCVDNWLSRHGSCPVCRQDVEIGRC